MTKRLCTLLCTYSKSVIFCYKLNWDGQQNALGVVQFVVPLHFSKNILLCTDYVPDYVPRLKNLEHFK